MQQRDLADGGYQANGRKTVSQQKKSDTSLSDITFGKALKISLQLKLNTLR